MATCQTVAGTEVAWSCHHHVWHLKIREVGASDPWSMKPLDYLRQKRFNKSASSNRSALYLFSPVCRTDQSKPLDWDARNSTSKPWPAATDRTSLLGCPSRRSSENRIHGCSPLLRVCTPTARIAAMRALSTSDTVRVCIFFRAGFRG